MFRASNPDTTASTISSQSNDSETDTFILISLQTKKGNVTNPLNATFYYNIGYLLAHSVKKYLCRLLQSLVQIYCFKFNVFVCLTETKYCYID